MSFLVLAAFMLLKAPHDSAVVRHVAVGPGEVLRTTIEGAGPSVVIVPGVLGGAYGFRMIAPRLAELGFRVIVIEPLGMGGSSHPPNADYSLTAQTTRLDRVLQTLGVSHAVIVGHSVGASLALRLACRRPSLARAVIALDGGANDNAGTAGLRRLVSLGPLAHLLMSPAMVHRQVRQGLSENSGSTLWITDRVVEGYSADWTADPPAVLKVFQQMVGAPEGRSTRDALGGCRVPALLLIGGAPHPSGIHAEEIATLKGWMPGLAVQAVPNVGLYIHEEQPDVVFQAIRGLDVAARTP